MLSPTPKDIDMDEQDEKQEANSIAVDSNYSLKKAILKSCQSAHPIDPQAQDRFDRGEIDLNTPPIVGKYTQWASQDQWIFVPTAATQPKLPPAVYEIRQSPSIGLYLKKVRVTMENLLRLPDTASDNVILEIQKFLDREHMYKEFNILYKRGFLLYGPPGTGKSCTIKLVMHEFIRRKGIVIRFDNPELFIDGVRAIKDVQPETPIVVLMEDIDSIVKTYNESTVLNVLDGVDKFDRIVYLATTNYPEQLGQRIMNRPSRFDKRFEVGWPSAGARKVYFEHLISGGNPLKLAANIERFDIDLARWVKDSKELSLAHLQELFTSVVVNGDPYKEAIETLQSMCERVKADGSAALGFKSHIGTDSRD